MYIVTEGVMKYTTEEEERGTGPATGPQIKKQPSTMTVFDRDDTI